MRLNSSPVLAYLKAERPLTILDVGCCEPLKAVVHATALGLAALMGAYNAAAWLRRRQSHLAVNAVIYIAAAFWEQRHVAHHLVPCLPPVPVSDGEEEDPAPDESRAA
jgi:hypothetical protein